MAVRPDAHWRSIVCAPAVTGRPRGERRIAGEVHSGSAGGQHRADDDVLDLGAVDARALHRMADRVRHQRGRLDVVERAAKGTADRRARGGDDDGLLSWRISSHAQSRVVCGRAVIGENARTLRLIACREWHTRRFQSDPGREIHAERRARVAVARHRRRQGAIAGPRLCCPSRRAGHLSTTCGLRPCSSSSGRAAATDAARDRGSRSATACPTASASRLRGGHHRRRRAGRSRRRTRSTSRTSPVSTVARRLAPNFLVTFALTLVTEDGSSAARCGKLRARRVFPAQTVIWTSVAFGLWHLAVPNRRSGFFAAAVQGAAVCAGLHGVRCRDGALRLSLRLNVVVPSACHALWNGHDLYALRRGEKVGQLRCGRSQPVGP